VKAMARKTMIKARHASFLLIIRLLSALLLLSFLFLSTSLLLSFLSSSPSSASRASLPSLSLLPPEGRFPAPVLLTYLSAPRPPEELRPQCA